MHFNEILSLIRWLNKNIKDAGVVNAYNQLHKILNQNAQPNQQKQPFEDQRKALDSILRAIPLTELGFNQIDFLDGCKILNSLGPQAADTVDKILTDNTHDIATAARKIAELRDPINQALASFQKVEAGLSELYKSPEEEYKEALVHVHFTGDAGINNIVDFKKWASTWFDIGRGIALSIGEQPEQCRVVGASHGSIIVALATTYGIAKIISDILLVAIKVRERVVDLQIQQEKLRGLKLSNDVAEKALQKEIEEEVKSGEKRAFDHLKERMQLDGEQENALDKSIKASFKFINNGGIIDVHVHDVIEERSGGENGEGNGNSALIERRELIRITREIREIEERVKLIEHRSEEFKG